MSLSRHIRSNGAPYFAAYQAVVNGMVYVGLPEFGLSSLNLTFRLDGVPQALASEDEVHGLFSVVDYGAFPAVDLLSIGVTPSGRIVAVNVAGDVQQTPKAFTRPGVWYSTIIAYDYGIGSWYDLVVNGATAAAAAAGTVLAPLLPTGYAQHILFNNAAGRTRCACSIAEASAFWSGATNMLVTWDISTDRGTSIAADQNTWPSGALFDPALTIGWRDPAPAAPLWGTPPSSDIRAAYARGYQTQFARRTRAKTSFYRRRVAWLS